MVVFSKWKHNIVTKRDAKVLPYEAKLVNTRGLKKPFWTEPWKWWFSSNMEEPHVTREGWSLSSISHTNVHSSVHGPMCAAVHVCSLHVQTVLAGVGAAAGKAGLRLTLLGEEEPYQSNTTTSPALSASAWLGCTRNCWEAAEPTCEERLLMKKYSTEIDFRKGSTNAAQSQMCDHIHTCEIVPLIL